MRRKEEGQSLLRDGDRGACSHWTTTILTLQRFYDNTLLFFVRWTPLRPRTPQSRKLLHDGTPEETSCFPSSLSYQRQPKNACIFPPAPFMSSSLPLKKASTQAHSRVSLSPSLRPAGVLPLLHSAELSSLLFYFVLLLSLRPWREGPAWRSTKPVTTRVHCAPGYSR